MEGQQKTDGADKEETEKIHEIRLYSGKQSQTAGWAPAGSLCAVTGLTIPVCQDLLASLVYKEGEEKEVSALSLIHISPLPEVLIMKQNRFQSLQVDVYKRQEQHPRFILQLVPILSGHHL